MSEYIHPVCLSLNVYKRIGGRRVSKVTKQKMSKKNFYIVPSCLSELREAVVLYVCRFCFLLLSPAEAGQGNTPPPCTHQ